LDNPPIGLSFLTVQWGDHHYFVLTMADSGLYMTQMAIKTGAKFDAYNNSNNVLFRNRVNGTWNSWSKVTTAFI
jgi:hypothetical protein